MDKRRLKLTRESFPNYQLTNIAIRPFFRFLVTGFQNARYAMLSEKMSPQDGS
jgi:hypothetical protein